MSVKAVEKVYKEVCDQYFEMLQDIKDIEKEASEGLCDPELVDRLKEQIAPLQQNYQRWAYIMYLLHQPQRADKHKGYQKRNKKLLEKLDSSNSIQATLDENKSVLNNMRNI